MSPDLPSHRDRDFSVEPEIHATGFRIRFAGNADMDAIQPLEVLLPKVHAELIRVGANEIEVDFSQLEFMNSTCLKLFVSWVADILEAPEAQRYKLRFRSNPEMRWQRRSLIALQCFTTEFVVLD
jgi:hypothetical protein